MIRVFLLLGEMAPADLQSRLTSSDDLQMVQESAMADVVLVWTKHWNRAARASLSQILDSKAKPTIILCARAEEPFSTDSIVAKKVAGVLQDPATIEQIVLFLRAAVSGFRVLQDYRKEEPFPVELVRLTPRELDILRLIADGEGNKSIAYLLGISQHTVKFHISSIFEKLNVSSRTEAVKNGITRGFISI